MREVDEAAGEAVADSVAAHTDAHKAAQDYIPIILDDDVRQKGRAKQKQMMISRGKLLNCSFSTSALTLLLFLQLKRMLRELPKQRLPHQSVRPSLRLTFLPLANSSRPAVAIDVDGAVFRKMCESAAWITEYVPTSTLTLS